MALSAGRVYETIAGSTLKIAGKLKTTLTFYKGALLVYDSGLLALPTDAAGKIPAGVYTGNANPIGQDYITTTNSTTDGVLEEGLIWIPFSGAAQTDVGLLFYFADSETVTKTAGSKTYAVICKGFKTGYVLLDVRNPIKVA